MSGLLIGYARVSTPRTSPSARCAWA